MWIWEQRALRVQPEDAAGVEVRVLTPLGMWKRKIQKTAFYQVSHYYCLPFLFKINNYVIQGFFTPVIVRCMKKNFNITKPQYSEHILPVLWSFVKSRFHCTWKQMTLSKQVPFQPHVHYYWHLVALIFLFRKCTTGWEPISKFPFFLFLCTK